MTSAEDISNKSKYWVNIDSQLFESETVEYPTFIHFILKNGLEQKKPGTSVNEKEEIGHGTTYKSLPKTTQQLKEKLEETSKPSVKSSQVVSMQEFLERTTGETQPKTGVQLPPISTSENGNKSPPGTNTKNQTLPATQSPSAPPKTTSINALGAYVVINKEDLEEMAKTKPFPTGWIAKTDNRGIPNFFNIYTQVSTYYDPRVFARMLPEGWEMKTSENKTWFVDHINKKNTWTDPRLIFPQGWMEAKDNFGVPYFVNHNQKYNTYSDPRLIYV